MAGNATVVEVANTQLVFHLNKSAARALTTLLREANAAAPTPTTDDAPTDTPTAVPGGLLRQLQSDAFQSDTRADGSPDPPGGRWFGRQGPGSTDSSDDPSSHDTSDAGALRTPQVIENFVAPGAGSTPTATDALGLDVWHTDGVWEAPDHYGSWFVVPEGQAAFVVAVSHDGGKDPLGEEEPSEELLVAPPGSLMPAAMYPDYVSAGPALRGDDAPKPLCARCAIAPLGPLFPPSTLRVLARDVSLLVRLLREGPAPVNATDAASALVEVDASRVCMQLDVFAPGQLHARCLAVAVHALEVRDWGVHGSTADHAPNILLGPFSLNRASSGGDACVVHVVVQDVCPDLQGGVESRVTAACAALRVQLDQGALLLLEELASGVEEDAAPPDDRHGASDRGCIKFAFVLHC